MINLNFSKISIDEAVQILELNKELNWVKPFLTFLKEYSSSQNLEVKTSGTTGKRKTLIVTKSQMHLSAKGTLGYFDLKKGNSILLSLSCDFIAGKMMVVRAIIGSLNLFIAEPCSDPSKYFFQKFDFVPLVPLQVKALIKSGAISNIHKLLVGGGKADDLLVKDLKSFNVLVFESFAMTETLSHFAIKKIAPREEEWFKTIDGFKLDTNKKGELIIQENPISGDQLVTKELVKLKSDSEFKWLGRSDNIVNSGGIILIPEEIENKLSKLISKEFVVTGIPDDKFGEKIVLVLQEPIQLELKVLNKRLSKFEKIKAKFILSSFPKTESGKIKRKEVIELIKCQEPYSP